MAAGMPLSEGFTDARRDLLEHPQRISAASLRNLSDGWAATLFERHVLDIRKLSCRGAVHCSLESDLPASPNTGFLDGMVACSSSTGISVSKHRIVVGQVGTGNCYRRGMARGLPEREAWSGPTFFSSFREERFVP